MGRLTEKVTFEEGVQIAGGRGAAMLVFERGAFQAEGTFLRQEFSWPLERTDSKEASVAGVDGGGEHGWRGGGSGCRRALSALLKTPP